MEKYPIMYILNSVDGQMERNPRFFEISFYLLFLKLVTLG